MKALRGRKLPWAGLAVVSVALVAARAEAAVAPLDPWPATPQLTATTGNPSGTFTIAAGSNRLLVVAVGVANAAIWMSCLSPLTMTALLENR